MNKSIATIQSPEFINLTPLEINPLMSACEVKVLYVGENRNHTYISKEVATEMAKTLRGAPIVGYYREEKEDFRDHGNQVVLDDEGIKFNCLTRPYGFVSPDAKVWFQEFEDTDGFGNVLTREYLMTTGYLWTGQFPECKSAVEGEGKPHSMELDDETLDGHFETNARGMDFFIINDATFSKLCILGDDVEPCFEGSKVSAPQVSTSFTKVDDNFKKTLFTMMQDLQFALKGGQTMEDVVTSVVEPIAEEPVNEPVSEPIVEESPSENYTAPDTVTEEVAAEAESVEVVEEEVVEPVISEEEPVAAEEPVVDETAEQFALLEAENAELKAKVFELETKLDALISENEELKAFKLKTEDAEKDAMIASFAMLSEEDKADVIQNKANYTLEEIESKLSVICVRKKVNFSLSDNEKNNNNMDGKVFTYSLDASETSVPAWVQAVKNNK